MELCALDTSPWRPCSQTAGQPAMRYLGCAHTEHALGVPVRQQAEAALASPHPAPLVRHPCPGPPRCRWNVVAAVRLARLSAEISRMPSSQASSQDDGNGHSWGSGAGGRAASLAEMITYLSCVCFHIFVSIFKMLQLKSAKVCLFEAESSTLIGKDARKE